MTSSRLVSLLLCLLSVLERTRSSETDWSTSFVITSTLDGKLTAVNRAMGNIEWVLPSPLGPLLSSTLASMQFGNDPSRLVPSLDGTIFHWEGDRLKPIPVSAETLLSAPFQFSNESTLVGSRQVESTGIDPRSGKVLYRCSADGCTDDMTSDDDDVLVANRIQQTVRCIDPRKGLERWNFTVGQFELKYYESQGSEGVKAPYSCPPTSSGTDLRLDAATGTISAIYNDESHSLWTHDFESPLTAVWTLEGSLLEARTLFSRRTALAFSAPLESQSSNPLLMMLGSHKGQLYVQPSRSSDAPPPPTVHEQNAVIHVSEEDISPLPTYSTDPNSVTTAIALYKRPFKRLTQSVPVCFNLPFASLDKGVPLYGNYGQCKRQNEVPDVQFPLVKVMASLWKIVLVILIAIGCLSIYSIKRRETQRLAEKATVPEKVQSQPSQLDLKSYVTDEATAASLDRTPSIISTASSRRTASESFASTFERDFEVDGFLGTGGFGDVYQVKKPLDGCSYAVKKIKLPKKYAAREKVLREVKALATLDHPNIIRYFSSWEECPPMAFQYRVKPPPDAKDESAMTATIQSSAALLSPSATTEESLGICADAPGNTKTADDFIQFEAASQKSKTINSNAVFELEGGDENAEQTQRETVDVDVDCPVYLFIQMELCEKKTLSTWLSERQETREYAQIITIFKQIVSAVEYVHAKGMMHRDLKPSNILFAFNGSVKIGDFGLVTYHSATNGHYYGSVPFNLNQMGNRRHTGAVGTELYMSPEQIAGKSYSEKVDIFSLGVIFFELISPFRTAMERHKTLSRVRDRNFPPDFKEKYEKEGELIESLLAHNPSQRPDAKAVINDHLLTVATETATATATAVALPKQ
ncbi:eukaryotic translation initiation factor 2-alpha kinase 3-like [Oscarella lobularis]|uniref:eukaryotic translation initiation factor 2-alpha kinase 3-like n=1 Tax=Oscarella lobularis TaxID=121494 RepID=UPI00331441C7